MESVVKTTGSVKSPIVVLSSYSLDPSKLGAAWSEETDAITPTHNQSAYLKMRVCVFFIYLKNMTVSFYSCPIALLLAPVHFPSPFVRNLRWILLLRRRLFSSRHLQKSQLGKIKFLKEEREREPECVSPSQNEPFPFDRFEKLNGNHWGKQLVVKSIMESILNSMKAKCAWKLVAMRHFNWNITLNQSVRS